MPSNYDQNILLLTEMEPTYEPDAPLSEVIVKYSGSMQAIEEGMGAEVEHLGEGFAVVTLHPRQIPLLYTYKEIIYIELPKNLALTLNKSLDAACVPPVQSPEGYRLTGEGVLIGIIDSGIDYTHPDFQKEDGTSRILSIWDQTVNGGNPPKGFKRGSEYDNAQLNLALHSKEPFEIVPSVDVVGHGTAVAGIAAGNGRSGGGRERGTAPDASLVVVKLGERGFESFARTTEIMRALKYILDKAEALSMPVVVNISFGTSDGSHDGKSLFETYVGMAAQRWKSVIVVASGNEGASGHHFSGKATPLQPVYVDFVVAEQVNALYLTLWKNFTDTFSLQFILPNGHSTGEISPFRRFSGRTIDGVSLRIYYGQSTHYNEDQEVYFSVQSQNAGLPQGIWRLLVSGTDVTDGRFDIWLPTTEEIGRGVAFTRPTADTTLTLPSSVQNVVTVGGYQSALGSAAPFSGRGFARGGAFVKPDLVAPAIGILSTRAGGGYDSFTGTSMAAPFVSGAAALMMQWGIVQGNDPFLYGQRVKSFLKKGAQREKAETYPNPIWGYGKLCLKNTMDDLSRWE